MIYWSGLSESNRHLNLGKVPYYHYTKAARSELFITRLRGIQQVSLLKLFRAFPLRKLLRNLRDAHRLHHWRPALAICESCGLFLVRIDATELLAVGVIYSHQKMMMAPPLILAKRRFTPFGCFDCFRHDSHAPLEKSSSCTIAWRRPIRQVLLHVCQQSLAIAARDRIIDGSSCLQNTLFRAEKHETF